MKNVAIYVCGLVSKQCTANGCLRTVNQMEDAFKQYEEVGCQLVSFNTCNGCNKNPVDNLKNYIEKFQESNVDVVHLSTCIRSSCNHYEEFAVEIAKYFDVVGYTHGLANGNNIDIKKGKL